MPLGQVQEPPQPSGSSAEPQELGALARLGDVPGMQGLCVLTGGRVGPHTDGLGKEGPREGSLGEGQVHRKFIGKGTRHGSRLSILGDEQTGGASGPGWKQCWVEAQVRPPGSCRTCLLLG